MRYLVQPLKLLSNILSSIFFLFTAPGPSEYSGQSNIVFILVCKFSGMSFKKFFATPADEKFSQSIKIFLLASYRHTAKRPSPIVGHHTMSSPLAISFKASWGWLAFKAVSISFAGEIIIFLRLFCMVLIYE